MSGPEPTADERIRLAAMTATLRSYGYVDVEQHGNLRVGTRVRHRGEQYREALWHGTGNVVALLERRDSSWSRQWGMPDVEMVVLQDKPRFGDDRLMQVAQYHVAVMVEEALTGAVDDAERVEDGRHE